jgi:hypothetical protein
MVWIPYKKLSNFNNKSCPWWLQLKNCNELLMINKIESFLNKLENNDRLKMA